MIVQLHKYLRLILFSAFVVLVACGDARPQNVRINQTGSSGLLAAGPTSVAGPPLRIELDGVRFALPRQHLRVAAGGDRPGFIVAALWPNFEGATPENEAEFSRPSQGRDIEIGLQSSMSRAPEELVATAVRVHMESFVGPTEIQPPQYGLIEHRAVGLRPGYSHNIARADFLVPETPGDVPIAFFCGSELGRFAPGRGVQGCLEVTIIKGFEAQIRYDRRLLPHWREIDAKARELIESFVEYQGR